MWAAEKLKIVREKVLYFNMLASILERRNSGNLERLLSRCVLDDSDTGREDDGNGRDETADQEELRQQQEELTMVKAEMTMAKAQMRQQQEELR